MMYILPQFTNQMLLLIILLLLNQNNQDQSYQICYVIIFVNEYLYTNSNKFIIEENILH